MYQGYIYHIRGLVTMIRIYIYIYIHQIIGLLKFLDGNPDDNAKAWRAGSGGPGRHLPRSVSEAQLRISAAQNRLLTKVP